MLDRICSANQRSDCDRSPVDVVASSSASGQSICRMRHMPPTQSERRDVSFDSTHIHLGRCGVAIGTTIRSLGFLNFPHLVPVTTFNKHRPRKPSGHSDSGTNPLLSYEGHIQRLLISIVLARGRVLVKTLKDDSMLGPDVPAERKF